ncbi:hypothetical protein GX411_00470 [Candidatus Fermentibacteria bacterium]|nr:hypothetical protein [Candidatus Fermentibacteria bacterium]
MNIETISKRRVEVAAGILRSGVESLRRRDVTRTGIRIYRDGFVGVAGAIGGFDPAAKRIEAEAALSRGVEYPFAVSAEGTLHIRHAPDLPDASSFPGEVESVLKDLSESMPDLIFSGSARRFRDESSITNDAGLDLSCSVERMNLDLMFKHRESAGILDGSVYPGSIRRWDRAAYLDEALSFCGAFLNDVELPAEGDLPVIFPCDAFVQPLAKLLGELNGVRFGSGASLFSGKTGQKLFSESFSLEQCLDPEFGSQAFFDDEGTVNEGFRYPVVSRGVVITPFTDKRTSSRFGLPLTGAASCEYDGIPQLGTPVVEPATGDRTLVEILDGRPGVFVAMASGGEFTPDGGYATPVQLGFLCEGGRLAGRLPELGISSNMFDMLGDGYMGVSKDSLSRVSDMRCMVISMKVEKA